VARTTEVEWYNPITKEYEWVTGVDCACYECRWEAQYWNNIRDKDGDFYDGLPFTKAEYRVHQKERATAYAKYQEIKYIRDEERKAAHTKETEALAGHGRPASVTTFFDLDTGNMVPDPKINGSVRWETNWRASIQED
jgi:hypothetical protein